jgi:hypothetical protein
MGPAAVQGRLWGTASHAWAGVVELLVRLSCGNLAGADVVTADRCVVPASEIVRWLYSGEPCGWLAWRKHEFDASNLVSRSQNIGPAR